MPAYTQPYAGSLLLTFSRNGETDDQRIAADGVKAVTLAMRMLAFREELRAGDRLTIERAANEPAVSGLPEM